MENKIRIAVYDSQQLEELLRIARNKGRRYPVLEKKLGEADVFFSNDMPANVVTLNAKILVKDMDTEKEKLVQVVFPPEENLDKGMFSILSPVGIALIGRQTGEIAKWKEPSGLKTVRIEEVANQPESVGEIYGSK